MKITVLSGSPKGEISVTLQYVKYLMKCHPEHEYEIFHIAQAGFARRLEQNTEGDFDRVIQSVKVSDGVIWDFPLYVMMVHANYKRFIELIFERQACEAFRGKKTIQIATSINFYDHTALAYMEGICQDLAMDYVGAYSAEMQDLLHDTERARFEQFSSYFFHVLEGKRIAAEPGHLKVAVVSDADPGDEVLQSLIQQFCSKLSAEPTVFNLSETKIGGSCLGCLKCGRDNQCVYEGKDGIIEIYQQLKRHDIIVFAAAIRDRYFSARWKTFVDRRFFQTHQPIIRDKQLVYLIDGEISTQPNLEHIIRANAEMEMCNLVGIYSSMSRGEARTHVDSDMQLTRLSDKVLYDASCSYTAPRTFLGKGGTKLFRDEIWGRLRLVFLGDHRYYQNNHFYDFPQQAWRTRLLNLFAPVIRGIPKINSEFEKNMMAYMIKPFAKHLSPSSKSEKI